MKANIVNYESSEKKPITKVSKPLSSIVAEKCIKRRMSLETSNELRQLQDILLESCARNFQEMFVDVDHIKKETLKREIKLESNLFERILDKGREINLIMPPQQVKLLLGFRKELNWQNIDLYQMYRGNLSLTETDLETISGCKVPVKKLAFHSNYYVTDTALFFISKFANTLEHLEIEANYCATYTPKVLSSTQQEALNSLRLCKIKMPRLRHLKLSSIYVNPTAFELIDFSSCFLTLEVLALHDYNKFGNSNCSTVFLIELLRNCKNLLTLSLQNARFSEYDVDHIFEAMSSLKNLRTLNLLYAHRPPESDASMFDISRVISKLSNLKNLEVSCSQLGCSQLDGTELKLDYLGAVDVSETDILQIPTKVFLEERNIESLFYLFGNPHYNEILWQRAMEKLSDSVRRQDIFRRHFDRPYLEILENAFLEFLRAKPGYTWYVSETAGHPILASHLSPDFWAKMTRRHVSSLTYFPEDAGDNLHTRSGNW